MKHHAAAALRGKECKKRERGDAERDDGDAPSILQVAEKGDTAV